MKNRTRRKGKKPLLKRRSTFKARELSAAVRKKMDEAVEHATTMVVGEASGASRDCMCIN